MLRPLAVVVATAPVLGQQIAGGGVEAGGGGGQETSRGEECLRVAVGIFVVVVCGGEAVGVGGELPGDLVAGVLELTAASMAMVGGGAGSFFLVSLRALLRLWALEETESGGEGLDRRSRCRCGGGRGGGYGCEGGDGVGGGGAARGTEKGIGGTEQPGEAVLEPPATASSTVHREHWSYLLGYGDGSRLLKVDWSGYM
jgi:hypothetical protein